MATSLAIRGALAVGIALTFYFDGSIGGEIDETRRLPDGTIVRLTGNTEAYRRTMDITTPQGEKVSLELYENPASGQLVLNSGTINGRPMPRSVLQSTAYSLQANGTKNVVLSQNAGMGHNGGPPLDDKNSSNNGNNNDPSGKPPLVPPPAPGMDIDYDKISTAKPWQATSPRNLEEQVLWNQVKREPSAGNALNLTKDNRFPASNGWQKMEATHRTSDGRNISIHYQYNSITRKAYDMKFTNK